MEPYRRLSPSETCAVARETLALGRVPTYDEIRHLVRARRLAELGNEVPVKLRTVAYVLMTSPEEVRALLDGGRLRGDLVVSSSGRYAWLISLDALKTFVAERNDEDRRRRLTDDLAKHLTAIREGRP